MKFLFFAAIAVISSLSTSLAAPRIVVSTPSFTPDSEVEVVFDQPVVADSMVGQLGEDQWFDITPTLPAKVLWKSPTSAALRWAKPPQIATTYTISLRSGVTSPAGVALPAGEIGKLVSESFRWIRSFGAPSGEFDDNTFMASCVLVANDAVDLSSAANLVSFKSDTGLSVVAVLDHPRIQTMRDYSQEALPWEARGPFQSATQSAASELCRAALRIRPAETLVSDVKWSIEIKKGIRNLSGTTAIEEDKLIEIGVFEALKVKSVQARVEVDVPRTIEVRFNHPLKSGLSQETLGALVLITPKPAGLRFEYDDAELTLHGEFSEDQYVVECLPGLMSRRGDALAQRQTHEVEFEPLKPQVALPSDQVGQLAHGKRGYRIYTQNVRELQIDLKQLSGINLVRAYQGYRHVSGRGPNGKTIRLTAPLPSSLIVGKSLLQETRTLDRPIDTSRVELLSWDQVLGGKQRTAAIFLSATGTADARCEERGAVVAQSIVQLTDIGLAWKVTAHEALVYAYSCQTGEPLRGLSLEMYGEEATLLAKAVTDADGLARLPRSKEDRHLLATHRDDQYITEFDANPETVGLWHFPVRYSWQGDSPLAKERKLFWFTDRSLYRPGETIHLKGIVRDLEGNAIVASAPAPTSMAVLDPNEQEIFTAPVTLSPEGSFDFSYTLPPERVGTHTLRLTFTEELRAAEQIPEDGERWYEREQRIEQARFDLPVRVAQFRRNAFEPELQFHAIDPGATRVGAVVTARYFQGTAVAQGKVSHNARICPVNFYPERFRDFLFGDHREEDWNYWYHYFGYDDSSRYSDQKSTSVVGDATLDAQGGATLEVDLPTGTFPTAREVRLTASVMDANQQTLGTSETTTVHPASVYVGVSRLDRIFRVGESVPFRVVAAMIDGQPFTQPLQITAKLSRQVNLPVRREGPDGAVTTENQVTEPEVSTTTVTLDPAASQADGMELPITPTANGLHFLTLSGKDPEGRPFATVCRFQVYGKDEFPWQYEDGLRIRLVAEKSSYRAGETARVLVLSPIDGTALVTIEREKVLRSYFAPLKASNPVIEIPLTADDAPNVFVSVLVVKGAGQSARQFPEPQLRLGYCELKIASERETLKVEWPTSDLTHRPGDEVRLQGRVLGSDGKPAAQVEVTLYAEDEGTLAVAGYETPDPLEFFYRPRSLRVESGISFENFIPEDPERQSFDTKGFFVGGGGSFSSNDERLRKRFDPCATWVPTLRTAKDGTFCHTFRLPDALTRYRVIAVAHQGRCFGSAETAITTKKDVMLEVKAPRAGRVGDAPVALVTLQNASAVSGAWRVRCEPPADAKAPPCRPQAAEQEVTLEAGKSATLSFPLVIFGTGEAVLRWSATPLEAGVPIAEADRAHALADAMETRFACVPTTPLLREVRTFALSAADGASVDLLKHLGADWRAGQGEVRVQLAATPLIETAGAIDFLLQYPYGCAEQTTSSLMPWCAVEALRAHVPSLASVPPENVRAALQAGVNRLLTMQQSDGQFSYWPGSLESESWVTSYAGLGLVLAAHSGAAVPPSAIQLTCQALIESLRGMAEARLSSQLEQHACSLMVLAFAGQPQVAYQNALADRLMELTPTARALLAAAVAKSATDAGQTKALLGNLLRPVAAERQAIFQADDSMGGPLPFPAVAIELLAWSLADPASPEAVQALEKWLRDRGPRGHWSTTWANGWSMLALRHVAAAWPKSAAQTLTLTTAAGVETISLGPEVGSVTRTWPLSPDLRCLVSSAGKAWVRVEATSRPAVLPERPESVNGLSIDRVYERLLPDGTTQPLGEPKPGDLIRTTLRVVLPNDGTRFLVVDDPLPALFETVDSTLASQAPVSGAGEPPNWRISHSELRDDRAVFFINEVPSKGTYSVQYLSRCTLSGQAVAPPAKVESMYDPSRFALSAPRRFATSPNDSSR